ncbi:unnamed protein product [Blepharisma stoltei]|uniref:Uncharacterized protein n=1 Tax=Blepharisma stoltei TaxID=1481888 RepID=A0AAU9K4P0_9CILI|nr:unnamed protein product [Blepharisma stoltei]
MEEGSKTLVSEDDVPKLLLEYITLSLQFIEKEEFENALEALSQSEELLEAITTQSGYVDPDLILVTIHNIALCHQKLNRLEECASYLDGCLFNIRTKRNLQKDKQDSKAQNSAAEKLKYLKYECKAHIQLCAIHSQLNKHESAFSHAKIAVKRAQSIIQYCYKVCNNHIQRQKKPGSSIKFRSRNFEQCKYMETPQYQHFNELIVKSFPLLEYLTAKFEGKRMIRRQSMKVPKLDMRSVLGVQHHNDWVYAYNIGDMMAIQLLSILELKTSFGVQAEFTRDLMLDKIFLLVVSHFCMATELRFLACSENSTIKAKEARIWHKKAMDYAKSYLPVECPLYDHVKSSYHRNYKEDLSNTINKKKEKNSKSQRKLESSFRSKRAKTPHTEQTKSQSKLRSSSAKNNLVLKEENRNRLSQRHKTPQLKHSVGKNPPKPEEFSIEQQETNFTEPSPKNEKQYKIDVKPENYIHKQNDMSHPVPYDELDAKLKKIQEHYNKQNKNTCSEESEEIDREEIIITSYDLYGIHSDEEDEDYENFQESDSTGGRNENEGFYLKENNMIGKIISGTGGGH